MRSIAWKRPADFGTRVVFAILLVIVADRLLFDGALGLSLVLFVGAIALASVALNKRVPRRRLLSILLFIAALAPLVENVSLLSVLVSASLLASFALVRSGAKAGTPARLLRFFATAPFRFADDLIRARRAAARQPACRSTGFTARVTGWLVPLALASVFVALFALANPIIDRWLALFDPLAWLKRIDIWQVVGWLFVFLLVWPFLRPRIRKRASKIRSEDATLADLRPTLEAPSVDRFLGREEILRSLAVFNLVFGFETVLDAAYLWGGLALPEGMTHAAYAHRGAYPLVVTALLAAGFVLIALRPGSAAAADRTIRRLVYLWTAQNVLLVASSMLRLDLYVDAYSLTYWRVAAFVWMALVGAGLLAIVARIVLDRSNRWLLGVNFAMLAAVLYASCFVNFAAVIANYNVSHSSALGGNGADLDVAYLISLGPDAIPPLDDVLLRLPYPQEIDGAWLPSERSALAAYHFMAMADWRAWTFRGQRLSRYLDATNQKSLTKSAPNVSESQGTGE